MKNGRGTAILRSTAGVVTSLGMVLLLIAVIVVPAVPVLAATPTLEVTTECADNDDHIVNWVTTSSNPTPDGGTADGGVTITQTVDYQGVVTESTVVGEYNAGNGYTLAGSFEGLDHHFVPGLPPAFVMVTVEVDQFNDGTGVGSVVMSSSIRIDMCKSGTTTSGATTTTTAVTITASVTAACVLENDVATFPITVTVTGDEGASGTVTVNGVDYPYTIDASGEVVIATDGVAGDNTVDVVDDSFGSILSEVLNIPDCSPGTTPTTDPGDTTPTTDPGDTTPTTDPGDTTPTTDPGDTTPTTDPGDTTPTTDPGDTTPTTDPGDTTPTTDPGDTTPTTTEDSSSITETPPVSVLPTEIDQTELPQTGIDNGPLAALGLTMLIGGAGLLVAVRRNEALESI